MSETTSMATKYHVEVSALVPRSLRDQEVWDDFDYMAVEVFEQASYGSPALTAPGITVRDQSTGPYLGVQIGPSTDRRALEAVAQEIATHLTEWGALNVKPHTVEYPGS